MYLCTRPRHLSKPPGSVAPKRSLSEADGVINPIGITSARTTTSSGPLLIHVTLASMLRHIDEECRTVDRALVIDLRRCLYKSKRTVRRQPRKGKDRWQRGEIDAPNAHGGRDDDSLSGAGVPARPFTICVRSPATGLHSVSDRFWAASVGGLPIAGHGLDSDICRGGEHDEWKKMAGGEQHAHYWRRGHHDGCGTHVLYAGMGTVAQQLCCKRTGYSRGS